MRISDWSSDVCSSDLLAGALIARSAPATRPLPLPGAVRAEALRPELWSRERAIITAEAAGEAAQRLSDQLDAAHASVREVHEAMTVLRSTSRAPLLDRKSTRLNSSH